MAFSVGGGKGGPQGEINVTPLIDIVLVLLIIFMVMTPVMLKEIVAKVPQKQTENVPQPPGENPIVVELDEHDTLTLNGEAVAPEALAGRVGGAAAPRPPEGRLLQDRRRRQLRPRGAHHGRLQGRRRQHSRNRHEGLSSCGGPNSVNSHGFRQLRGQIPDALAQGSAQTAEFRGVRQFTVRNIADTMPATAWCH